MRYKHQQQNSPNCFIVSNPHFVLSKVKAEVELLLTELIKMQI